MQQNDGGAVGGAGLGISDIERPGVDLFERRKGCVRPRFDRGQLRLACLRMRRTDPTEFHSGNGERGGSKKTAPIEVEASRRIDSTHF